MKKHNCYIIYYLYCFFVALCSCDNETIPQVPEQVPTDEYVRLTLSDGNEELSDATRAVWDDPKGSGSLTFRWEPVALDSKDVDKLSFILSDGHSAIPTWESPFATSDDTGISHTGLSVAPRESNTHYANFQTARYYTKSRLDDAVYCCAVAGTTSISGDEAHARHLFRLEMPATFTQTGNQDPSFLRDYMYMYTTAGYNGSSTSLRFKHIPSTFRFVITNTSPTIVSLESVSVSISSKSESADKAVAATSSDIAFDWSTGVASISYSASCHDKVTTVLTGDDTSLAEGHKYIAYALVFPMGSNDALRGKLINFTVKSNGMEHIAYQLDADLLAKANGSDIYNWMCGKSYTIKMNLGASAEVGGEILVDNTIEVTSNVRGSYTLRYEGANGRPLAHYADICTLTVDEIAHYRDFIDVNIAPFDAAQIGIYDATGNRLGTISIAGFKPTVSTPIYSFGLLSDLHCQQSGSTESISDLQRALTFFNQAGAAFTSICGDITENGTAEELSLYKGVVDNYSQIPVYTTTGNHDCQYAGISESLWSQYTGMPLVYEHTQTLPNGSVDHFLYLGMTYWRFETAYLDYHISWLERKLEAYRKERCFVITHLFFPDRAGNLNDIYQSTNWLTGPQLERLQALCDNYVNSIWLSGHSHWKWDLQRYQDRANIHRKYNGFTPASGWCIHVPSCANPTDSDGISSRVGRSKESEGAIVQVHANHIDLLGLNLKDGKYLPIATYLLDTSLQEVAESEIGTPDLYLKASDFVINPDKKPGTSIKDAAGMPHYVEVTFTGVSQGYNVTNSSFKPGASSKVSITIEDVQAIHNGAIISVPEKVGFYSGDYHMTSTNAAYVNNEKGVQFQTSSSCPGPFPFTLRMKVSMQFY